MSPEDDIIALMHAADKVDHGRWLMRCPAHRGAMAASLEVVLVGGRYSLRCIAGCTPQAIVAAAVAQRMSRAPPQPADA